MVIFMKNIFKIIIVFAVVITFSSCNDLFLDADPSGNNTDVFEVLWKETDMNYSYFTHKKINWKSVYEKYKPKVNNSLSETELFVVLDSMLLELNDLHVTLSSPFKTTVYKLDTNKYHSNFDLSSLYAHVQLQSQYGTMAIGRMKQDNNIGYIHINSFSDSPGGFSNIDIILDNFSDTKGLIIDIRNNSGGNDANAKQIAARFCDSKRVFGYIAFRNGLNHTDLSVPEPQYIEPAGYKYSKPVILITSRMVASSAEEFVYMMSEFPNVTIVGDTTIGASGNPFLRELPNGWVVRLSRWIQYDSKMRIWENIGFPPDMVAINRKENFLKKKDLTLEKALELIK